jgi:hypothetical protein
MFYINSALESSSIFSKAEGQKMYDYSELIVPVNYIDLK